MWTCTTKVRYCAARACGSGVLRHLHAVNVCIYVCVGAYMCGNGWLAKGTSSHVINFISKYVRKCNGHATDYEALCSLLANSHRKTMAATTLALRKQRSSALQHTSSSSQHTATAFCTVL